VVPHNGIQWRAADLAAVCAAPERALQPPLTDSPIGELTMLRYTSVVDDYSKHFIALSCCDTMLSEPQQIQLYITGLSDPLCTDVALQQPASLDDAVIFTQVYEQWNASHNTMVS
jgi:hypothetical protein